MKYLILKRRPDSPFTEDPFTEFVAAGDEETEFELPFEVDTKEISDDDVEEERRESDVVDVVPSIPFTLIEPVEESTSEAEGQMAWGIAAVGGTNCAQDGSGVTVAVLDTGIERAHAAFSGLEFADADLMDFTVDERGRPGAAPDIHGHGTHVAATIFGQDVDGVQIGVARGIRNVLIGKVLGPQGGQTEAVFNAIEWSLKRRADVISMSLGMDFRKAVAQFVKEGLPEDIAASRALQAYRSNIRLFDRLAALVAAHVEKGRGALLVAAAGNASRRQENLRYTVGVAPPAAADGFVSVGAVGRTGNVDSPYTVARFSNTGCLVAAPGVSILSAKLGGGLGNMSGTSMATPHVAGVLALWTQKLFSNSRPNGWAKDVQRELESRALPLPGEKRNDVGLGLVQAP